MKTITLKLDDTVYSLLEVLTRGQFVGVPDVEGVINKLIDHAQQGVYCHGASERDWLCQAFGDDWTEHLEPGAPCGRRDSPMFQRPKKTR